MGRSQKGDVSDFVLHTCPKEAEAERGRTKGDHPGHEAALGGTSKGESAVVSAQIRILDIPSLDRKPAGPALVCSAADIC